MTSEMKVTCLTEGDAANHTALRVSSNGSTNLSQISELLSACDCLLLKFIVLRIAYLLDARRRDSGK